MRACFERGLASVRASPASARRIAMSADGMTRLGPLRGRRLALGTASERAPALPRAPQAARPVGLEGPPRVGLFCSPGGVACGLAKAPAERAAARPRNGVETCAEIPFGSLGDLATPPGILVRA